MTMATDLTQIGPTPDTEEEFSIEWVTPIFRQQLIKEGEVDPDDVTILEVRAKKNCLQGILSTTYTVDVDYKVLQDDEAGKHNINIFIL